MASTIPSNPTSHTVGALLPKLHDADPDYRFMSLNDLFQVLTIGKSDLLQNDYNTAARTVDGIIKTLDDQNGEVQNLAIKCLGPLVTKLPSSILAPLIEKLSTLNTENSVDNSIPAMALRTVVSTLPRPIVGVNPSSMVVDSYSAISKVLIPRLVGHLVLNTSTGIKLPNPPIGMLDPKSHKDVDPETVDVLIEVVRCFGPMLQHNEVEALQVLISAILETNRASSVAKKRAVVATSILAVYLKDDELSRFVSQLIESLRNPHLTLVSRRLYITILGSLARSIPARFGPYLKTLAPFVLSAVSQEELDAQQEDAEEDGDANPEVDDVREAALVALEGFLSSCGSEMRAYTPETINAALRYLRYDPNYNDDDDEDMEDTQDEDEDDAFDDDDDFEAEAGFDDDDDDASWKVRRCAAKLLYTLISTRASGDLLDDGTLYSQVAPVLVQRFNERVENVRLEVIATTATLIRKTGEGVHVSLTSEDDYVVHAPTSRKRRRESSSTITFDTKALLSASAGLTSPTVEAPPSSGPRADLARLSPAIIKSATKLLKGNSIPTKQALIGLLNDFVSVQRGGLSEFLSQIIDPVIEAIRASGGSSSSSSVLSGGAASATTNTLRIAALQILGDIAKTHSSSVLLPFLPKIVPGVVQAVGDKYYKISSEAIATVEQLIKALTPPRSKSATQKTQGDLQQLYKVVVSRVSANDADLEVRQRAIHALGILLARTSSAEGGSLLSEADKNTALDLLNERLKNETTRLAAVRAIDTVAALTTSKGQFQAQWVREVSLELSAQLRKANRALRGSSLAALKNLVAAPSSKAALDASTIQGLVSALTPLLTPSDLHLLGPALLVISSLVSSDPKLVVTPELNSSLCELLKAPLSGAVLDAVLVLVTSIGEAGVGQPLMAGLLNDVSINGDPTVVGKVIGTLLVAGGSTVGVDVNSFLAEVNNPSSDDARHCLALAVVGEAGLRYGATSPLKPVIFTSQFDKKSDKVPLAAAVAMGRAGAGNISVFLPEILKLMDSGGHTQYLLLHSIKEILQQASNTSVDISKYTKAVWDRLLSASQAEDNKAVGAECIGRLAIIDPKTYMPQLQKLLQDPTPSVRAMIIQAIRYTLPDGDEAFDAGLKGTLIDILTTMLKDPDLENRRLAMTTLNSAAHNKPDLIVPNLGALLPLVITESEIKPELIREVMMGPFKHKVDDGLEVRKSAYETLYSLMETAFTRISILDFYDRVIAGLQDEHDIRSLCNLMLTKLVVLDIDETTRRLDSIAECYKPVLSVKLKENAVKQEIEKQEEAVRSVIRVSVLLHNAIPTASSALGSGGQHQTWRGYWEWLEKDFEGQLKALREEGKDVGV